MPLARIGESFYSIPFWKTAPMLRIFMPLASGVVIAEYYNLPSAFLLLAPCILLALLWAMQKPQLQYARRWWWGLLLQFFLICSGMLLLQVQQVVQRKDFAGQYVRSEIQDFIATLEEPLVPKQKSYKANVSLSYVDSSRRLIPLRGKAIIYLQLSDTAAQLQYGSQLLMRIKLEPIANSPNPGAFDYARWCARQGIYYQAYLRSNNYRVLPANSGNAFNRFLFQSRSALHARLALLFGNQPQALGLSEALITGYRGDLDKETVEQFANTGVVHVIAISGMHLALIFVLLQWLCKPLKLHPKTRWLSHVLVLAGVWFFCLMTGAASSAVRAAIMLTVLVIGQMGRRQSNIVNSLALAATLQLLIDPYAIWHVGFQLSYAAVLSIGIFYKPIAARVWHANLILRWLGQMLAVTLAAQILTFPIALLHFHQMPLFFLLSNMVVVPAITMVLYALLIMLTLSLIMPVAWFASAIAWVIMQVIQYVQWVNGLPGNRLSNILIAPVEMVLLFIAIVFISIWLMQRRPSALLWGIGTVFVLLTSVVVRQWHQQQTRQMIVYHVPGMHAIDVQVGNQSAFIGDSALTAEGFLQRFHLLPSRIAAQCFPVANESMQGKAFHTINYGGRRFLLLDAAPDYSSMVPVSVDWLIPGAALRANPVKLLSKLKPQGVLIDGALPQYQHARWRAATDSLHLRLHIISTNGAFIMPYQ